MVLLRFILDCINLVDTISYMDCITEEWTDINATKMMYTHYAPAIVHVPPLSTEGARSGIGLVYIINGEQMETYDPITNVCTKLLRSLLTTRPLIRESEFAVYLSHVHAILILPPHRPTSTYETVAHIYDIASDSLHKIPSFAYPQLQRLPEQSQIATAMTTVTEGARYTKAERLSIWSGWSR
jgi:hypothetical protein